MKVTNHCLIGSCIILYALSAAALPIDFAALDLELRSVITNRSTGGAELLEAISRLGPVNEPPQFWTRIANDKSYNLNHRSRAVFALFRRHVPLGNLAELSGLLAPARWIDEATINQIEPGCGPVPVEQNVGESVFLISPFSRGGIYLRLLGPIDLQQFKSYLKGDPTIKSKPGPAILEIGYSDDYYQWLRRPYVPKREP